MIDLSADLGEGAPDEPEVWPLITSANVACGGHTGDADSMTHAVHLARSLNVRLGAHPSYPDRANFGRKSMSIAPAALRQSLESQIASLRAIAEAEGIPLHHVKPHGALYNEAHHDRALAEVVIDAIAGLTIVCSATSQMAAVARERGMTVIREAFADRRYNPDTSLVSRAEEGSLLTVEEAAAQATLLARVGVVIAKDGTRIAIEHDTICIHADMPHAAARLRAIRAAVI